MTRIYNHIYHQKKRHGYRDPYSGGGAYAGHEGSASIAGVAGVHVEIIKPENLSSELEVTPPIKIRDEDPYARKCDFTGKLKVISQ